MYIRMTSNCYQKHKERLRKKAREKYQKGRKKVQERHQNLYYQPIIKRYQYHYPVDVVILP